ncbi:MAG TPA: (d)CMP kinase [Dehalococcoidia bacterium]|nr:(d)CMP kinase [Dehalococcoidia bacterium]
MAEEHHSPPGKIAIDGPAACGKSAVGNLVANRLGFRFLDTGMMYRAFTWLVLDRNVDPEDEEAVAKLARGVKIEVAAALPNTGDSGRVIVDGRDATAFLVRPDVEAAVSLVSRLPAVREAMVRLQREVSEGGEIVVAGRDIGTVVLPDADLKVYLDASRLERARRRYEQARLRGQEITLKSVLDEMERRDGIDSSREASPLRAADDAVVLPTDDLNPDQVVERILALTR